MGWIWRGPDDAHGLCLLHLHIWLHPSCCHHYHLLCQDHQDHTVYGKHTRPMIRSKTVSITVKVTYPYCIAKLDVSSEARLSKSQNTKNKLFVSEYPPGKQLQYLEKPRTAEQGQEGQEADHHGGSHGNHKSVKANLHSCIFR